MKLPKLIRKVHIWAAILIALPILLVIGTGLLLQVKKEFAWIQPVTKRGSSREPSLSFDRIVEIAGMVSEAGIKGWEDIDRLDIRPSKGMLKVRAKNSWEIQLDAATGEILQVAYRRSDLLESLHDGSFFHEKVKFWVFLPTGLFLLSMWLTGIYLLFLPYYVKQRRRRRERAEEMNHEVIHY